MYHSGGRGGSEKDLFCFRTKQDGPPTPTQGSSLSFSMTIGRRVRGLFLDCEGHSPFSWPHKSCALRLSAVEVCRRGRRQDWDRRSVSAGSAAYCSRMSKIDKTPASMLD